MNGLLDNLTNLNFVGSLLFGVAVTASILTFLLPMISGDSLNSRMKSVTQERERIRERERDRMKKTTKVSLRTEPKAYIRQVVQQFNLSSWLGTDKSKITLAQAGYRGPQAEMMFLFSRLVAPIALFLVTAFYIFVVTDREMPFTIRAGIIMLALYIGVKLPEIFLHNTIAKRRDEMRRAFPDALDLLLICVESGMSIEHAIQKVSLEIVQSSFALSEEMALTMAELSYLPDRRTAYENMAMRTGLDAARQISTVLIQAERYGTPLGQALRVVSDESRANRMAEAEKKAASLPPKLTVPMILFFLPVLFVVIMTPAGIQVSAQMH